VVLSSWPHTSNCRFAINYAIMLFAICAAPVHISEGMHSSMVRLFAKGQHAVKLSRLKMEAYNGLFDIGGTIGQS
jgi:hypothetical protein